MPDIGLCTEVLVGESPVDIAVTVGRRQVWTPPVPSTGLAVFANPNAYMALSDGGRVARYTGADGFIGGCFSSHTIDEPTEIQFLLGSSAGACGFQLYNGTATAAPIDAPFGQWYGQPGLTVMLSPTWSKVLFANYGLPGEIGAQLLHDIGYFPSVVERGVMFIRPDGRGWIRSEAAGGAFHGGGNPATNTTPSFILGGSSPVRFSAASNNANAYVELPLPDAYTGTPIAGFRRGPAG